jgi:hypothetical protein
MLVTETTQAFVEAMNEKFATEQFRFDATAGRNYDKIINVSISGNHESRSVHAFIDRKTNALLKAAGWAAPAKGLRFNLSSPEAVGKVVSLADKFGGYLYR